MKIPNQTIAFLEKYFDRIFVITLERAGDRQVKVKERLEGLTFEFFYGVDKHGLSWEKVNQEGVYDDKKARQLNRYSKGMVLGHIACALSHRKLYQHIVEKGYQRVLIFEDDAVPLFDKDGELQQSVEELPANWEVIYFGYNKNETATPALKRKQAFYRVISHLKLIKWSPLMVSNLLPKPYSPHLQKAGFHDLTHSYAVTREACLKLIRAQTPVVFNADPLVSHLIMNGELSAFITRKKFFTQEQFLDPAHRSFIHH
ncbi:MAG TPA: glycosyltransferase family 25 protein [Chitinophagaceae bacterium]|nr:glycosyltransferase family 25 protein [Chitinophagaceae bacterium]HPH31022.1 glycosyltransferase family 25 protein [Chitinophagaceae bacterium]HPN58336.1 glycosyltransferase family 25 protein [Chitinophagaceae bacterium]